MVILHYDLIRYLFREQPYCCLSVVLVSTYSLEYIGQSVVFLKEKLQCGLNMAFDSKVTRSCDTIIGYCGFDVVLVSTATVVFQPIRASLMQSATQSNLEQICV